MNTSVQIQNKELIRRLRGFAKTNEALSFPIRIDRAKRIFDIAFTIGIAPLLIPAALITAVALKLSSPGPLLYVSSRVGQGGKIIRCWKFRTMHVDAEKKLETVLRSNPSLLQEWNTYRKLKNDPRIFPLGSWLRRISLDEIPQFWNVLQGSLSLVGPRAPALFGTKENYLAETLSIYGSSAEHILSVKPGITGIWQVSGRSNISVEEKNAMEANYALNRTFLKDLMILAKTIPAVLCSKGAC